MRRTRCDIGNNSAVCKSSESISAGQFLSLYSHRLLKVTFKILEYGVGMCIGAVLGWVVGWYTGGIYVDYFEPAYLSDFAGLEDIMCWQRIPHVFAGAGVFAGVVIGAMVTFCSLRRTPDDKISDNEGKH